MVFYKGIIKNTASLKLDMVTVIVEFFDENDIFLFSEEDYIYDMESNTEENFQVSVSSANVFYQDIDHVAYEFMV